MTCFKPTPRRLAAGAAIATALGLSTHTWASESSYEMISYLESPSGRLVAAGEHARAIDFATKRLRGSPEDLLVEHTNLCIAYTATRDYVKARRSCDAALALAREVDASRTQRGFHADVETAKAMTNRGVLKALTGDVGGAAEDFTAATAMFGALDAPERNLARIDGAMTDRLAMTEAR